MVRRIYFSSGLVGPPPPLYDADAAVLIAAALITDPAEQQRLHDLFVALKACGAYQVRDAYWGMAGATSAAHCLNWKDPRDADDAFRLTFEQGASHTLGQVQWNGISQYANTHYVPADHLSAATGANLTYYSTAHVSRPGADSNECGAYNGPNQALFVGVHNQALPNPSPFCAAYVTQEGAGSSRSDGLFAANRPPGTPAASRIYRDGGAQNPGGMDTPDSSLPPTLPVFLGALNVVGYGAYGHSNRPCGMAALGPGLTEAQLAGEYAAFRTYKLAQGLSL